LFAKDASTNGFHAMTKFQWFVQNAKVLTGIKRKLKNNFLVAKIIFFIVAGRQSDISRRQFTFFPSKKPRNIYK